MPPRRRCSPWTPSTAYATPGNGFATGAGQPPARPSSPEAGDSAVACQQVLARDPQPHGAAVTRPSKADRPFRVQRGEQGALIRCDKTRPGWRIVLRRKSESREALMEEDGRGGKRLDVCQPATGACEPREFVKRADELPPKLKANRDGRETAGMKRCHEGIVEMEDADPVAGTNGRAAGELERSVTTPDRDAGRGPHLRRRRVEAVKKPVQSVVDENRPVEPRSRGPHRRHHSAHAPLRQAFTCRATARILRRSARPVCGDRL